MSDMMWIGALVGFVFLGPVFAWVVGMFNPLGYLGVPPWRVPSCTCGKSARGWCETDCARMLPFK